MKQFMLLASFCALHAGFISETPIKISHGYTPIRLLDLHNRAYAPDLKNNSFEESITHIAKEAISRFTIIVVEGETIYATDDQKFYLAQEQCWCQAQNLRIGQLLLKQNGDSVRVDSVQIVESDEPLIFYDITVQKYHTFCVTKHDIVAHNFVIVIPILTWGGGAAATWFEGVTAVNILYALATGACFYGIQKTTGQNIDAEVGADGTLNGQPMPGTEEYDRINNPAPGGHVESGCSGGGGPQQCICGHFCNATCGCNCSCGCGESRQSQREKVYPKVKSYEQARNQAYEIIKDVNYTTSEPYVGRVKDFKGLVVGRQWHGGKVVVRVDWDPKKGAHINIDDYRNGKGMDGIKIAIPFEGDLETVLTLVKSLQL